MRLVAQETLYVYVSHEKAESAHHPSVLNCWKREKI